MKKLLCKIGLHRWKANGKLIIDGIPPLTIRDAAIRECNSCGKTQYLLFGLGKKGKVPFWITAKTTLISDGKKTENSSWDILVGTVIIEGICYKMRLGVPLSFSQQVIVDAYPNHPWPKQEIKP